MISEKALQEFKEIWKEEVGEEIVDEEAVEEAVNLLTVMNAVYRPVKKRWLKEFLSDNGTNEKYDNSSAKNR